MEADRESHAVPYDRDGHADRAAVPSNGGTQQSRTRRAHVSRLRCLPLARAQSPALKSSGIIWNDDTLDEWIKDPQHFIPGNTMTFAGMKDRRQRADLLAFLKDATRPEQLSRQPARNSAAEHRTRRCHIDHRAPCAGVLARIPRHCA